jgi:hypothetical protein
MAVPRTPSARLTDCLAPNTEVWHLRCSVLRETPMPGPPNLNFKKLNCYGSGKKMECGDSLGIGR